MSFPDCFPALTQHGNRREHGKLACLPFTCATTASQTDSREAAVCSDPLLTLLSSHDIEKHYPFPLVTGTLFSISRE